ncbi:hypothetical protein OAX78_04680, partial [Planctomycetota bacterium]|nr:hypothetical protein [Planctomycetota bacterium]
HPGEGPQTASIGWPVPAATGTVQGLAGTAAQPRGVWCVRDEAQGTWRAAAMVDPSGEFVLQGVPAGPCRLVVFDLSMEPPSALDPSAPAAGAGIPAVVRALQDNQIDLR